MLADHEKYVRNMEVAVDIFKSEPTTGTDKLMYYLNLLLKYKNLDHLSNDIIKKQSILEIYHLDVIFFMICMMGLMCLVAIKLVATVTKWLVNKHHAKND